MEGITPVMNVGTPAATNGDGWGGGCGAWLMWVIVIFAMMGGGWGGFGNRAGLTQAEMQQGFNHQDEMGQLRGVSYGLADSTFSLNTTMLQGQAGLEKRSCRATMPSVVSLLRTASRSRTVAAKQTATLMQ